MLAFLDVFPLHKLDDWLHAGLRASVYLIGAALVSFVLGKILDRIRFLSGELIKERGGPREVEWEKHSATIASTSRRLVFTAVWALALVLALKEFQFDVGPILAGAGVAGLAVGFAAQSILKDWISGFFLLAEGQIRINDVVKIGDVTGTVETLTMRTTVLRAYDGTAHVFSNGAIQNFSNLTMGHSYFVFEVAVEYEDDPERLMSLFQELGAEMQAEKEWKPLILAPMEVAGIDRFTEQGVVVKARIKTLPSQQWAVGREVLRRLRRRCAERGITIATAQRALQLFEKGTQHDPNPVKRTRRT